MNQTETENAPCGVCVCKHFRVTEFHTRRVPFSPQAMKWSSTRSDDEAEEGENEVDSDGESITTASKDCTTNKLGDYSSIEDRTIRSERTSNTGSVCSKLNVLRHQMLIT